MDIKSILNAEIARKRKELEEKNIVVSVSDVQPLFYFIFTLAFFIIEQKEIKKYLKNSKTAFEQMLKFFIQNRHIFVNSEKNVRQVCPKNKHSITDFIFNLCLM